MNSAVDVASIGAAIRNEKRLFIIRKLIDSKNGLTWSEITSLVEEEFKIRVNPNTISFHLKFLLDQDIITKAGNRYNLIEKNNVTKLLSELVG